MILRLLVTGSISHHVKEIWIVVSSSSFVYGTAILSRVDLLHSFFWWHDNLCVERMCASRDKQATFKPKKSHPKGTKRYDLHKHAKATLGSGNLKVSWKRTCFFFSRFCQLFWKLLCARVNFFQVCSRFATVRGPKRVACSEYC